MTSTMLSLGFAALEGHFDWLKTHMFLSSFFCIAFCNLLVQLGSPQDHFGNHFLSILVPLGLS